MKVLIMHIMTLQDLQFKWSKKFVVVPVLILRTCCHNFQISLANLYAKDYHLKKETKTGFQLENAADKYESLKTESVLRFI